MIDATCYITIHNYTYVLFLCGLWTHRNTHFEHILCQILKFLFFSAVVAQEPTSRA